jgi:hypothetical protein
VWVLFDIRKDPDIYTQRLRCQYLHFCTSKASKLSTCRLSSLLLSSLLQGRPEAAADVPEEEEQQRLKEAASWPLQARLRCQSLYFCTSKSSKLSTSPNSRLPLEEVAEVFEQFLLSQYLYFCTSKASNLVQQVPSSSELSVSAGAIATAGLCKRLLSAAHSIRQHTSAYVSIRQHTSASPQ